MCARTGLWEPWVSNHPGPPGPHAVSASAKSQRCGRPLSQKEPGYLFRYAHPAVRWRGRDMPQLGLNAVFTWRISTNDGHSKVVRVAPMILRFEVVE